MPQRRCALSAIAAGTLLLLFGSGTPASELSLPGEPRLPEPDEDGSTRIDWDDLIPEGYRPQELLNRYNVALLRDDDPRIDEMTSRLREAWQASPVLAGLEGRRVCLPGLALPLQSQPQSRSEFLLVPYRGACLDVPPPPANQTVYVAARGLPAIENPYAEVQVTGTLHVSRRRSHLAEAGYTLVASRVEPYTL